MVTVFGVIAPDLIKYYGLTQQQGDSLYGWMNFGSCALSFIPGICYDRLGPSAAMAVGTVFGVFPVALQLFWSTTFPECLGTMEGLIICYILFGLAASFYNVIGSFAPLAGFLPKDTGKVSAVVQVALSLGLSVQSTVFDGLKSAGGDFIEAYLIYVLVFNLVCGVLMCAVLRACRPIFFPEPPETAIVTAAESLLAPTPKSCSMSRFCTDNWRIVRSVEFAFMSVVFILPIGFSFSFMNVEGQIAEQAVVEASFLARRFGFINAIGRILTSVPLDYTKCHPMGGVHTYIMAALAVFLAGILCLALPSEPGAGAVTTANSLMALGYGGMLGIVPMALRLIFGTENLGLIYGLLYFWVYIAVIIWGMLAVPAVGCVGVACYRPYCIGGSVGTVVTMLLGALFIWWEWRKRKLACSRGTLSQLSSMGV